MNGNWKSRNGGTRTIVDLLQVRAGNDPDRVAYRFLTDGEIESAHVTYAGQAQLAKAIAATLQEKNAFGERALLLYPPTLEFINAFLGCLYAGVIAVPAYPPRGTRSLPRLMAIAEDAKPKLILTTSSSLPTIQNWVMRSFGGRDVEVIATDKIQPDAGELWQRPLITEGSIAFLQYTSGSTSSPKGVMVSHANLMHNEEMIRRAFGQSESSIIVSWLPLYHDMGLIGGVLQPLYLGAQCILMSPLAFVQKPVRWLKAISTYQATTSGGPNFAYELCSRKVQDEERAGLNLSTWTVAFNGAEPVRAETLERFAQTFADAGFRRQAFYPCYGLAEATLFVTGGSVEAEPNICALQSSALQQGRAVEAKAESEGQKLVGCGQWSMEQQVVIVDPETHTMCASGEVGEIWISGPSIAQGYWNRPEETARDFRVRLPATDVQFLRTGDLGFLLNGELFVTGRLKDLIIVRGRNFYPQDIEHTAENSHPALLPGCGAAFFVEAQGEERVVVVQEIGSGIGATELQQVADEIRSAIAQEHELSVHDVVLIRQGTIRKTSSGKIQRHASKEQYLKDELHIVSRSRAEQIDPANPHAPDEILNREKLLTLEISERQQAVQEYITGLVAQTLRIPRETLQPEQSLSSLGLDSMEAIELKHALEVRLNVSISLAFLLEEATTNELIDRAAQGIEKRPVAETSLLRSGTELLEFPLSYGQKGLWFTQQLAAESSAYNLAMAARVSGPLDVEALQRALQSLLDRHSALRTSFHQGEDGQPRQNVHRSVEFAVEVISGEQVTEDGLKQQLNERANRPFDLGQAPLLRVAIFRRSADEHALLMTMHHLAGDFWSFTVAFDELMRFYFQETGSGPAQVPDLELRYSDYVQHQGQQLESKRGEELWAYWQSVLRPPLLNLDLHTDSPRPALQTYCGGSRSSVIDPQLAQSLRDLSRSTGATLYTVLLGAFQVLLHRYTSQEDIVVGSPVTGRGNPQFANIVGFFTNPLALRSKILGHISFRTLLGEVRRTVLGALDHQDYPFPLIVERLQPARDPSRSPIFQAMFILQQAQRKELKELSALALGDSDATLKVGPLTLRGIDLPEKETPFDLTLMVTESTTGLLASLQYSRDLFRDATAERMLGHFQTMLSGIALNPDLPVERLPLLSAAEQDQLRCWNATQADYPAERLIFELFERQVERTPDTIAVEDAIRGLTYRELHDRTNRLANYLRKSGIGPEVIVGVCLDRSVDVAIALLGILKAGGAYLPIDPFLPESRTAFMLEDSQAALVLGHDSLRKHFHTYGGRFLALDTDWQKISAESPENLRPVTSSENIAYLIYTSGSTGRPKGVQIHHQAVVNFLASMAQMPGMSASDVLVSVTTMSFDIFGLELYLPLTTGAKVVLASREVAMDGSALLDLLKRSAATVMQATPATWQLLLSMPKAELPPLRALCGGDILSVDIVRELLARGCPVWNLYGPTETTIWSSVHHADINDDPDSWTLIGRPIAQTQIYIMDANLEPVPIGVPGELIIGGDGVARGYWRRAALTAEKFIPDPLGEVPGARMYRTGDLACRRLDGTIEFLGRLDNQVKIRGFRIELQEVERALSEYPGVRQAVVVARSDSSNNKLLAAYLVREENAPAAAFAPAELRRYLSQRLPEAFVPSRFTLLESLPLTPNGKVDRKALPDLESGVSASVEYKAPSSQLERTVADIWKQVLKVDRVGTNDNFFDLGGHSLLLAQVNHKLRDLGFQVSMLDLFRSPTIASLTQRLASGTTESRSALAGAQAAQSRSRAREKGKSYDIAIIGMAGSFPKAGNVAEFWNKIAQGEECISRFADEDLQKSGAAPSMLADPAHVKAGGVLDNEDLFDAGFFGFNPREAELMDPQQRLFLECAWHALEDAGYSSDQYEGRTGVFAGAGLNTYLYEAAPALGQSSSLRYQAFIGNDKDFLATRVSYKLNLKGPSVAVQTACSTSLVAVHLACQSVLSGECDMALAGGVSVRIPQREGYIYEKGGILSPDGHCRAFDKNAEGTVFGSGMGVIVMKPLEAALEDNDTLYAIIKGSAINNDGAGKIGYTAPSVEGQAAVVSEALKIAGVDPETVGYIEAHGTGTSLGDPIEVAALAEVFGAKTNKKHFCGIGSVKTNIGHLDTAAGIAGLIKTVCALKHGQLPPSINFSEPNPAIEFENSPFYVNTQLRDWSRNGGPRRAGISSFGIGGTNAHVVVEEAPPRTSASASRPWQLLTLSARTDSGLEAQTKGLADAIRANADPDLADVAYTLQVGRRAFEHRRVVLCSDREEALGGLETLHPEQVFTETLADERPQIAFLFPGQGSQYVNMGRELYETEPAFRRGIEACSQILKSHSGLDLHEVLFCPSEREEQAGKQLEQTAITQPVLFSVEYALARLWMEWGIMPQAMIGHSIGEYVAACLAGVFSLEDALSLVALRGKLMQSLPAGAMVGVRLSETEVASLLSDDLSIAAVNSPASCVVSGTEEAIEGLEKHLGAMGVAYSRLHTSHAFHSAMMEPVIAEFVAALRKIRLQPPSTPYISNLTGTWITAAQATDPEYWAQHLRQTVRFADGLKELLSSPNRVLLEVGPGHTLSALARQQSSRAVSFSSLPHANERCSESRVVLQALGRIWLKGAEVNWSAFSRDWHHGRVPLPGYPFERKRYWIKASSQSARQKQGKPQDDWFYVPTWRQAAIGEAMDRDPEGPVLISPVLIFEDECGFTERITKRLRSQGVRVTSVRAGDSFVMRDEGTCLLNAEEREHYDALLAELRQSESLPRTIIYGWGITSSQQALSFQPWNEIRSRNFDALLFLAQALEKTGQGTPTGIIILSNNMQKVSGEPILQPEKALLLGPARVLSQEYPTITCRSIDVLLPEFDGACEDLIDGLLVEITAATDPEVAYRHGERWIKDYSPLLFKDEEAGKPRLREKGVYLITGGLGAIGLTVAEELVRQCRAKLILTGRSEFPQREAWDEWLMAHGEQEPCSQIIRKLQSFEQMGSEVWVRSADVSDHEAMLSMVQSAQAHFGQIHGVIHAAGVPGGGIIQLKQPQMTEAVLKPKVLGTTVLHSVLSSQKLDFFLLCSSITSIAGGFGQSDYCAANAFCDAFAQANFRHRGCYTVAVNWDRWNEIGMAVKAQPSQAPFGIPELNGHHRAVPSLVDASHPLLGAVIAQSNERTVYVAEFSPERCWVLSEHKVAGRPIVPGTTYLEMARAAFVPLSQGRAVSIRQVVFLYPLAVKDGESRFVFTIIEKKDDAYSFRIVSKGSQGDVSQQWQEHARGEIGVADSNDLKARHDLTDLLGGLQKAPLHNGNGGYGAAQDVFIVTGQRWDVVKEVYLGANQAVAVMELGLQLSADLDSYQLHPALLDVATGFAHFLTQGDFLPLTYDRILLFGPMPGRAISHLRMHSDLTKANDVLTSDISILDPGGDEVVRIQNFSMKRVTKESLLRSEMVSVAAVTTASIELQLQQELTPGLSPKEGAEIFRRIVTQGRSPQMIVCTREIHAVLHDSKSLDRTRVLAELQNLNSPAAVHARPQLSSDFSAPTDEMEQRIAAVWQRVLGVERVGIYDNFFELGGTSLNGIQLAAELKKDLNIELPSVTIFESPTVAALAKHLRPGTDREQFKLVQSRAERKKQALETTQRKRARVGAGSER